MHTPGLFRPSHFNSLALIILVISITSCGAGGLIGPKPTPPPTSANTFYVSLDGSDEWSGMLEAPNGAGTDGPFRTIKRAKDEVSARLQELQTRDIFVYIREGTYYLNETLVFFTQDSGHDGYQVIYGNYPGETPVISGGKVLTGWEPYDGNIYTTTVGDNFSTLFENDTTSVLARHPNQDSGVLNPGGHVYMKVADLYEGHEYEGFYFNPETFPVIQEPDNLEIVTWNGGPHGEHHWRTYFGPVRNLSYTEFSLLANLDGITSDWHNMLGPGTDFFIQNALELLDSPGEFYRDGATLYYWPRQLPIEDQTIVAPLMKTVFKLKGSSTDPVENITFEGLVVRHTEREPYLWANSDSSAAFFLTNAANITIKGNRIHSIGGRGILGIGDNVRDISVESNLIYDIGDTAVQFNGWDDSELNSHHSIINNHIHHTGLISPHGMGLFLSNSSHNRVAHNLFHNIPNTAINLSGKLSEHTPGTSDNVIEFNEIYNVTLDFQDMGVIYLGYTGPNNQLQNNYFHDSFIPFSFGGGIYMDEGAQGTTINHNLIENLQKDGSGYLLGLIEAGDVESVVRNNILAYNNVEMGGVIWPREYFLGEGEPSTAAETPPNDIDVVRNIFYNNDGPIYSFRFGDQQSWFREANHNLFYNDRNFYMVNGIPDVVTLEGWRTLPDRQYDKNSIVANPLFVNPEIGDYRLRFDSPAYDLGFEDINFADIGLTSDFPFTSPDSDLARMFITSNLEGDSANLHLSPGEHAQLDVLVRTASGYVADPGDYVQKCVSDDLTVATVDHAGEITPTGPGVTRIYCSVEADEVKLSMPVYVLVETPVEEATQLMPPEISPTVVTPFMGILMNLDFETDQGSFAHSPSHNSWNVVQEKGEYIYCGYSEENGTHSSFGAMQWDDYQVDARIRIVGGPSTSAGIRTRNKVGGTWSFYSHSIAAEPDWEGLSQSYCDYKECHSWKGINTNINPGEWYQLRAEVEGDKVRTYLNGRLMLSQNLGLIENGNIGWRAKPGTTMCVDDIVVRSLDRSEGAMATAFKGTITEAVSVLLRPNPEAQVLGNLASGVEVFLSEYSQDGAWIHVRNEANGLQGWVPGASVGLTTD